MEIWADGQSGYAWVMSVHPFQENDFFPTLSSEPWHTSRICYRFLGANKDSLTVATSLQAVGPKIVGHAVAGDSCAIFLLACLLCVGPGRAWKVNYVIDEPSM